MTRSEADTACERRKLFADIVLTRRDRGSAFLTIGAERLGDIDGEGPGLWIQLADQTFNMDVTEAELDWLKGLLSEFLEFHIDQLESSGETEGTNVRITTRSGANCLINFTSHVFQAVYGRDESCRVRVTAVWSLRLFRIDSPNTVPRLVDF